ncbi:hypothetical protein ACLOJK_036222 [Asimina triloba]
MKGLWRRRKLIPANALPLDIILKDDEKKCTMVVKFLFSSFDEISGGFRLAAAAAERSVLQRIKFLSRHCANVRRLAQCSYAVQANPGLFLRFCPRSIREISCEGFSPRLNV